MDDFTETLGLCHVSSLDAQSATESLEDFDEDEVAAVSLKMSYILRFAKTMVRRSYFFKNCNIDKMITHLESDKTQFMFELNRSTIEEGSKSIGSIQLIRVAKEYDVQLIVENTAATYFSFINHLLAKNDSDITEQEQKHILKLSHSIVDFIKTIDYSKTIPLPDVRGQLRVFIKNVIINVSSFDQNHITMHCMYLEILKAFIVLNEVRVILIHEIVQLFHNVLLYLRCNTIPNQGNDAALQSLFSLVNLLHECNSNGYLMDPNTVSNLRRLFERLKLFMPKYMIDEIDSYCLF